MNYALYILETALRDEIQAHNHALNYSMGTHAYDDKIGSESTRNAFKESLRLAEERIPQLQDAIARINDSDHP